ncbi:DoxX family protein [Melioribacteraceae bacterium 4301-Me]|uniref:DoxX family protein n=1 Tax=Pyranulibacter aquaticus TaxID=3163344 RepID=UPI0035974925
MKVALTTKYVHEIYAITRIVIGILFISHGIQKFVALINGNLPADNLLLIIATIIETIGGLLIIIGWQTHLAAFILSGEMAVAYFIQHAPKGLLPIKNGGELAVFYCFVFLFISAYGSGKWSLDNRNKNLKT